MPGWGFDIVIEPSGRIGLRREQYSCEIFLCLESSLERLEAGAGFGGGWI